jgi:hypothetical protein
MRNVRGYPLSGSRTGLLGPEMAAGWADVLLVYGLPVPDGSPIPGVMHQHREDEQTQMPGSRLVQAQTARTFGWKQASRDRRCSPARLLCC